MSSFVAYLSRGKQCFLVLAALVGVFVICFNAYNGSQTFMKETSTSINRPITTCRIPLQQCARHIKDCSRRALQRNNGRKWITIWLPDESEVDVSYLTQIPGWKTVVVGDGPCPRGCRYPTCVFFDPASQAALGSVLTSLLGSLLPPNDPAKKNIAYLYAIKQQAEYIYDTDVNTRPLHNLTDFFYGDTTGLVYVGGGFFNYFEHYEEYWYRPPGFVHFGKRNNASGYILSDISKPDVQYGLVKVKARSGPRFQSVVPTVFVGSQSFAPFDSSNTLFSETAFWGLFTLPGTGRSTLRSYFIQTLLRYIHGFVGFLRPNAHQDDILQATKANEGHIPEALHWYLYDWKCRDNKTLRSWFMQLSLDLLAQGFISTEDSMMLGVWLSELGMFGYKDLEKDIKKPLEIRLKTNKIKTWPLKNPVKLSPSPGIYYKKNPDAHMYEYVSELCENFSYPLHVENVFEDILLIITFNYASLYKNIMYLEALYGRYFSNILFCGPNIDSFRLAMASLPVNSSVLYVTGVEIKWHYFHECTVYAMNMDLNVKGYLQIGDDTLMNVWNLKTLSRDRLWFRTKWRFLSLNASVVDRYRWIRWHEPSGKVAMNMTFKHIESVAKKAEETKEKSFYNQYIKHVGNFRRVFYETCDFFYIPHRLKENFIYFTRLFLNSTLLVEATIPTMILGLDDEKNIIRVSGKVTWLDLRNHPEKAFNPQDHYLHAFKGQQQMKIPNCKTFMCKTFLPTMVKRMSRK